MKIENIEKNKIKMAFEVSPQLLEEGIKYSYNKNKSKVNIPGFRKGKVPRKLVEQQYGVGFFYEDAINYVFPIEYDKILRDNDLNVVSRPEIDVLDISKETGITFEVEVYIKPEVSIQDYKGITYAKFDDTVKEEDVDAVLQKDRDKNSRLIYVTDRSVALDDILTIDFEGFIDDEPFEGGKGENYELTIGSKTFIDTFEDQLIGHNLEEEVSVNVTFPENYHAEALKGKPALFKVKIKEIKLREFPELNDDFAQDVSEFDTLDEYKDSIREKLKTQQDHAKEKDKETKLMDKLIEKVEVDVPPPMVENHINQMLKDFEMKIRSQGLDLETYLQYTGESLDSFTAAYTPVAKTQVKGRLALEKIAELEDIQITEEAISDEMVKMGSSYKIPREILESRISPEMRKSLANDLKVQKALQLVIEAAVEVEAQE